MATIQKRITNDGKIRYRVLVRLKGHPVQSETFERLTDAKNWAADRESDIRNRRHFPGTEAKKHTVAELITTYLDQIETDSPKRYRDVKPMLEWWKDEIGYCILANLNEALVSKKIAELSKRKRKLLNGEEKAISAARVNRYIQALSHVCTVAVKEWKWLAQNPLHNISRKTEPRGRVRFLDDGERKRLLDACKKSKSKSPLYLIVILALSTGARHGEIMGLTWDAVDFERNVIVLHDTKNGERRVLPLAGHALDLMRSYHKEKRQGKIARINASGRDLLFPAPHDETKPYDIRSTWETALEKAKVENFRFHDLRHSAASYLAMNGASSAEIAEVLGHKSLEMVKRYAHLSETHTRGVVASMNERIFGND